MRIAIVSASYKQGLSYQENVWAEEMARLGHTVRVFNAAPDAAEQHIEADGHGYHVQTIASTCLPRHIYFTRQLGDAVATFAPELILWFGVPMFFGRALYQDARLAKTPAAAFFSLNVGGMHAFDVTAPGLGAKQRLHALAFHAIRGPSVVSSCLRADLIVANTPESRGIILLYPRSKNRAVIAQKIVQLPLGFSPHHFAWTPARRAETRAELGYGGDDVVLAMSSRFATNKEVAIEASIRALQQMLPEHPNARVLLIGLADNAVSRRFRAMVAQGPHPERFILEPFAGRERLSALFHAADVALFARPSISCQEAMGTGLSVAFADDGSMDHLVPDPVQGRFFVRDDVADMARVLGEAVVQVAAQPDRSTWRTDLAQRSRWLGYDHIAQQVFERLGLA
jgi:glycosyltransferase involved in cell wall biosynthesis